MNPFKYIKCLIVGHDILNSKSICAIDSNHWLKKCNCCGLYVMNGDVGRVIISEKSALEIKREFDNIFSLLRKDYLESEVENNE